MKSHLTALMALSILVAPQISDAAPLSASRLKEIYGSRDGGHVVLEGLRSRDRELLVSLGRGLQERYGQLLEGAEIAFSRIREGDHVFYRIDFLRLASVEHARGICEILETTECIVEDQSGTLRVLEVTRNGESIAVRAERVRPFAYSAPVERDTLVRMVEESQGDRMAPAGAAPGALPEPRPDAPDTLPARPLPRPDPVSGEAADPVAAGVPVANDQPLLSDLPSEISYFDGESDASADTTAAEDEEAEAQDSGEVAAVDDEPPAESAADDDIPDDTPAEPSEIAAQDQDAAAPATDDSAELDVEPADQAVTTDAEVDAAEIDREEGHQLENGSVVTDVAPSEPLVEDFSAEEGGPDDAEGEQPRSRDAVGKESAEEEASEMELDEAEATLPADDIASGPEASISREVPVDPAASAIPESGIDAAPEAPPEIDADLELAPAAALPAFYDVADLSGSMDLMRMMSDLESRLQAASANPIAPSVLPGDRDDAAPRVSARNPGGIANPAEEGAATDGDEAAIVEASRDALQLPDSFRIDFDGDRMNVRVGQKIDVAKLEAVVFDDTFSVPARLSRQEEAAPLQKLPLPRPAFMPSPGQRQVAAARTSVGTSDFDALAGVGLESLRVTGSLDVAEAIGGRGEAIHLPLPRPDPAEVARMLVAQAPSLPTAAPASPAAEPFAVETNADRLSATLESLQRSERGTTPAAEEAPGAAPARAAQSLLEQIAASAAANRDTAFVRSDLVGGAPSPPASQAVPAAQPQPPAAPAPVPTLGNGAANLTAHTAPAAEAAGIMARNAEFDDDRRQKVSNPDLRIELSYVTARDQVAGRVEHLRTFFPEVMLRKGRFFGATIPSSPGVFIVGIEARDIASRDDLVWYMERMEIPWAMRR